MDADHLNELLEETGEVVFLAVSETTTSDPLHGAWVAAAARARNAYADWRSTRDAATYAAYLAAADQADAAQDTLARAAL
jgi:hypothetical protein